MTDVLKESMESLSEKWVEWLEPGFVEKSGRTPTVYLRVSVKDAVAIQRNLARNVRVGFEYKDDLVALRDFMECHWASLVENPAMTVPLEVVFSRYMHNPDRVDGICTICRHYCPSKDELRHREGCVVLKYKVIQPKPL